MPWPPPVLPINRTNADPQQDTHPNDHNALALAINDTTDMLRLNPGFFAFSPTEGAVDVAPAETQVVAYTFAANDRPGSYMITWMGQTWTDQTFYIDIWVNSTRLIRTQFEQKGAYESMVTSVASGLNPGDVVRVVASVSGPGQGGMRSLSSLYGFRMF